MTVPEENRPKTTETDQELTRQARRTAKRESRDRGRPEESTEMAYQLRKAMSEADLDREDLTRGNQ
ncbi:hypothetical protein [Bailinhaonella thermotolerans]|uniref:Uncharacterized protein n=1 Tax=Bailinhaonella thermotolerans TaxID=1070861 RepID=A0A3A4A8D5_9ACTN|nr:hypothetical protein [Bailinhaonella thermotolerans]RJL24239.1 hypothetical protein D5H75_30870 [Bailinhaonella thermotolerans]